MPNVGGTKFPYSKEGITKAKAWAEMTGKPIKIKGKYYQGGEIPEYGFGGWLKKATKVSKKSKKWWDKNIKGTAKKLVPEGSKLSKALTVPERYKGMSWKHATKMKPMDFAAALGPLYGMATGGIPGLAMSMMSPVSRGISSLAANKAQKMYGSEGLSGDIGPEAPAPWIDPNLFGARQRFGKGADISGLMSSLMGGGAGQAPSMQEGGQVPAGRRMYGTNPRRRPPMMQTSQQGMPMRGSGGLKPGNPLLYKKGGKIPKGWHV